MSLMFKIAKSVQIFLIRRNMAGGMGEFVMTITTTGRKTGNEYTTPVTYIYDGPHLVAFTLRETLSDWYKNARKSAEAVLTIKGESIAVYVEEVSDDAEQRRLFDLFKAQPKLFERLFKIPLDASEEEQEGALDEWAFLHFTRIVP